MKIIWQGLAGLAFLGSLWFLIGSVVMATYLALVAIMFLLFGVIGQLETVITRLQESKDS